MTLVKGGIAEQIPRSLSNIAKVPELAGGIVNQVLKMMVFLIDTADVSTMNAI